MKKIMFLIHDLGPGGAERALVNLVNHMDRKHFDISVTVLFGGGIYESQLSRDIHFSAVFPRMIPGNTIWMKLLTPEQLHKLFVKDRYDIEVAYLEGPSARVIAGCKDKNTKKLCWIHTKFINLKHISRPFRNVQEMRDYYSSFDVIAAVSKDVGKQFVRLTHIRKKTRVVHNTIETETIHQLSAEAAPEIHGNEVIKFISVGSLKAVKGYDRLLRIALNLYNEGLPFHLYIVGDGPDRNSLESFIHQNSLQDRVTLLGFSKNPFKYVAKCDCFVCSSYTEGMSTAATEAIILGIPVCTVEVSGMRELIGHKYPCGLIVENEEKALENAIRELIVNKQLLDQMKEYAIHRGEQFDTKVTVRKAENIFLEQEI